MNSNLWRLIATLTILAILWLLLFGLVSGRTGYVRPLPGEYFYRHRYGFLLWYGLAADHHGNWSYRTDLFGMLRATSSTFLACLLLWKIWRVKPVRESASLFVADDE